MGLKPMSGALAVIAVVSALFTALLEIVWIWAYRGYAVSEILSIYCTLDLGTPSPLKILAFGLLIALGPGIRQARHFGERVLKSGKLG
jgi:hypothetical protein